MYKHQHLIAQYERMMGTGDFVAEQWRSSRERFIADMWDRTPTKAGQRRLEPIDPDLGFSPDNAEWCYRASRFSPLQAGLFIVLLDWLLDAYRNALHSSIMGSVFSYNTLFWLMMLAIFASMIVKRMRYFSKTRTWVQVEGDVTSKSTRLLGEAVTGVVDVTYRYNGQVFYAWDLFLAGDGREYAAGSKIVLAVDPEDPREYVEWLPANFADHWLQNIVHRRAAVRDS